MVVMLVYDDPVPVLENGATHDRSCLMSGSDPILPRLLLQPFRILPLASLKRHLTDFSSKHA